MHIVYLTSEFMTEKQHGGLATYLGNISSIMSKHGHKVTIITLSNYSDRISYGRDIDVIRIKDISSHSADDLLGSSTDAFINSWNMFKALIRENKRYSVDIVQAANYRAIGFFRSRVIPTVVRASSDSSLWRNAEQFEFHYEQALTEKKLEDYLELWCVKCADAAFAPSRFCAAVIGKRTKRKYP